MTSPTSSPAPATATSSTPVFGLDLHRRPGWAPLNTLQAYRGPAVSDLQATTFNGRDWPLTDGGQSVTQNESGTGSIIPTTRGLLTFDFDLLPVQAQIQAAYLEVTVSGWSGNDDGIPDPGRPSLVIEYVVAPEPAAVALAAMALPLLRRDRRAAARAGGSSPVAAPSRAANVY